MYSPEQPTLISHHLCPYVQRAAIALMEKGVTFKRVDVDLSNKPDWFLELSPLGKTPLLKIGGNAVFESAVILEYLEETQPNPLHAKEPLERADQRSWIEFSSAVLNDIAGFYGAADSIAFDAKVSALSRKFARLEQRLDTGPYVAGRNFSLVDAAFGPVFRYFDVFDQIGDFLILEGKPKTASLRSNLAARPSVQSAVTPGYEQRLLKFLEARGSHLSRLMQKAT